MKKSLFIFFAIMAIFTSCHKMETPVSDMVDVSFGYKLVEAGSMYTKAETNEFDIKSFLKEHGPSDYYTLRLAGTDGRSFSFEGRWSENKTIRVPKGVYDVSFSNTFQREGLRPTIKGSGTFDIKENGNYVLEAQYSSYLILADINEVEKIEAMENIIANNTYYSLIFNSDLKHKVWYFFSNQQISFKAIPNKSLEALPKEFTLYTKYIPGKSYVEFGKFYFVHPQYEDMVNPMFSYTLPDMVEGAF